jgi:hypothetical protein
MNRTNNQSGDEVLRGFFPMRLALAADRHHRFGNSGRIIHEFIACPEPPHRIVTGALEAQPGVVL